jgi:hypothetical protein
VKARRLANPDKVKSAKLKSAYGITLEQRDDLLIKQGSVCAICETDTPSGKGWHVDHRHDTKAVRGILCSQCNVMLGMARDNTATLAKAIAYLES